MSLLEDGHIVSEEDHHLEHASSVQGCIVLITNRSNNMQIHVFISWNLSIHMILMHIIMD